MSRATLALAIGASLIASCIPPGVSGPGFRWAPPEIRGEEWSERVSKLHATLTVVDEYHGTRVYVVHLPETRVAEFYLPHVDALDACALPAGDDAYVLLEDGRIVRATQDLEAAPVFAVKGGFELGSAIALSPDGSTIALLHQPRNDDWSQFKPYRLTLIDLASGRASDLPGEFEGGLCWAADGKSLFLTGTVGTVLQRSLVPAEPARLIAHGRGPLLSEDGKSLLFSPPSQPPREWTGVAWRTSWTYLRWTIGTTEEAEALPVRIAAGGEVVAVSADGLIVHESEPDERLPLEHSGFLMRGPYWRGGISVFDPAGGTTEPLFVGIAPNSIQWRWD